MTSELKELNEEYYSLYGRLHENKELLTEEQSDFIAKKLFETYKAEYEVLYLRAEMDRREKLYALNLEYGGKVPKRRFWLFPNRAAKVAEARAEIELEEYFAEKESADEDDGEGREEQDGTAEAGVTSTSP
jgi:hypothetical protein